MNNIDEPTDFVLANNYYDTSNYNEAIISYKKRIEMNDLNEEVWYCYYQIGKCYQNMANFSNALYYWLEGYNLYPNRIEGLYEIIKHYRDNQKNKLAMQFYKMVKEILDKNENIEKYLFLQKDVYTYLISLEYIIFAFYNGIKNVDDQAVQVLNNSNNATEITNLLSNMKYYKHIINQKSVVSFDNSIDRIINNENVHFTSSSSCLIKNPINDGYLLNIRYVSYYVTEKGKYIWGKNIITLNKFAELDNDLNIIKSNWFDLVFDNRLYIGVEDVRIYFDQYKNSLKFTGTGYHANNKIGVVSGIYNTDDYKFEVNELKQSFNNSNCEKNWVFVDWNNDTHIIYSWYPLKICKLDNNVIHVVETKQMPKIFTRARGSTCGFVYDKYKDSNKEIWFIVHIVSYEDPRHYYHLISVFDSNMNLLRYSAPFKFNGEPVEYCLSIIVEDDRVLINYSTWDKTTRIGVYDKNYINSIVKYIL